ncbi:hypothetical protein FHS25_002505 [Rhizobium laguerreae]|uniref:Propionyl-coenzyme A carboxylase alpha polypeptide n=1 Tax=Rhizobium laguerreae TaxID=1076926 RepID=A0ABR6G723_9HYPH|nr:hypothetical protein [Rhizobium laguerreae]
MIRFIPTLAALEGGRPLSLVRRCRSPAPMPEKSTFALE